MNRTCSRPALATCVLLLAAGSAGAEPLETSVTIRVQAHDAKFIGSGVGEMNVIVEDAESGAFLAAGRIAGGTGDTDRLIKTPIARGATLADDQTAAYVARLKLERPTRVRIRALGPLQPPDAAQELTVTTWVVPGRPIGGDGIVLRLPGLIVAPVPQAALKRRVPLVADVKLMCGCPITRGGLWDADDYEVRALVEHEGHPAGDAPLAFTGQTNRFAGAAMVPTSGRYQVTIWAHNSKTGNTGATRYTVDVP
jgi:hypothetical protein